MATAADASKTHRIGQAFGPCSGFGAPLALHALNRPEIHFPGAMANNWLRVEMYSTPLATIGVL